MARIYLAFAGIMLYLCAFSSCKKSPEQALTGWELADSIVNSMSVPIFPEQEINILDLGAVSDGVTDCTSLIQTAIDSCSRLGGGQVVVPEGVFLCGALKLKSNVNLHLETGSVLRFSTDRSAYLPLVQTRFEGMECMNYSPFIYACEQENIAITGSGTLDGQGADWWAWKGKWGGEGDLDTGWKEGDRCQKEAVGILKKMVDDTVSVEKRIFGEGFLLRPNFIQPYKCRNVLISGIRIIESPMWVIHPVLSENVFIKGVRIESLGPNNDGCNPECCNYVLIEDCYFNTGDDCIAIKSGRNNDGRNIGVASENILIRNCTMAEGHGGVVIGSEMSGNVRYVFAENCVMDSPHLERAIRIKSNSVRGGIVEHVYVRNIQVKQVREAMLKINMFYAGETGDWIPQVSDVYIKNVTGMKSDYAVWIKAYNDYPVKNLYIMDCDFSDVKYGNFVESVENVRLENLVINGAKVEVLQ